MSKIAKHTSGPWTIVSGTNQFFIMADDKYIAKTVHDSLEYQSNARLIAAAPDLLAQLDSLLYRMESEHSRFPKAEQEKRERCMARARAALAKADNQHPTLPDIHPITTKLAHL